MAGQHCAACGHTTDDRMGHKDHKDDCVLVSIDETLQRIEKLLIDIKRHG